MRRLCDFLQHRLNGLHIYCFLMECGLPDRAARPIARAYETLLNPALYSGGTRN